MTARYSGRTYPPSDYQLEPRTLPLSSIQKLACTDHGTRVTDAVRALIENSLDIGANQISIAIESGGYTLIKVSDNGVGIRREQVPSLCRYHTTSKMRDISEFRQLKTIGFHGSALAHFSCLGKITITTHHAADAHGTRGKFAYTTLLRQFPVDVPFGTTVEIKHFLGSYPEVREQRPAESAETKKVQSLVSKYAVVYHGVAFDFSVNGYDRMAIRGTGQIQTRLRNLVGTEATLLIFGVEVASVKGECYLVSPKALQVPAVRGIFLNGRLVSIPAVKHGIDHWYNEMRGPKVPRQRPTYLMLLSAATERLDIQQHLSGKTVRLSDEAALIRAITQNATRELKGVKEDVRFQVPLPVTTPQVVEEPKRAQPPPKPAAVVRRVLPPTPMHEHPMRMAPAEIPSHNDLVGEPQGNKGPRPMNLSLSGTSAITGNPKGTPK